MTDVQMKPSQLPPLVGEFVACDTESSGLYVDDGSRVSVVSVAWIEEGKVRSYAFPFDQGIRDKLAASTLFAEIEDQINLPESEWVALLDWLEQQRLVFHNAKHDLHHLRAGTRHWEGRDLERAFYWDTMVLQRILDPIHPAGLKQNAIRFDLTGAGRDKQDVLKAHIAALKKQLKLRLPASEARYDLADWSVIAPYATDDAVWTIELADLQFDRLEEGIAPRTRVAFQHDLTRTLYRMECRGIGFDVQLAARGAQLLRQRLKELSAAVPFTPTLPGAKRFFFEERGVPIYAATEKGAPKLDDEITRKMVRDGIKWAQEWSDISDIQKALSMWYVGWPNMIGPDGRLRTSFKQTHVKSGRVSVERVQLHAIPKDDKALEGVPPVKSLFRARDGYKLWNLDLSQAELRVATQFAGCVLMKQMLADGADLHGITTEEIFGIKKGHPDFIVKRDIAKRLTFGGIFQIGARTFQATLSKLAGIEWSLQETEIAVKRWRRLYPEYSRAYYHYMNHAERHGWIELIGHERSFFAPGRDYPNTAWSRRVQGSLAKGVMRWLVQTEAQAPGALLLTVHDSAVLELPDEDDYTAYEVADRGAHLLTEMFDIEMKVDVSLWHKEAA